MKKFNLWFALSLVMLAGCACSRDLVPDNVLEGLHKPVITSINPEVIRTSGGGFLLTTMMDYTADEQYVLYIDEHKVGQVNRGEPTFAANAVGWLVTKETLQAIFAAAPNGGTFSVRVTGIKAGYDISSDFDRYREYVSEPFSLEIGKGETTFSNAKRLFPEWTHSSEPVIRCDPRGNIFLAWREKLNGVDQAFFSFSADNGETWSQVLNISRSQASVTGLDLGADGAGHFYMTWTVSGKGKSDVYICRSLDNGATWHLPLRLNGDGEKLGTPSLAIDDRGDVFIACLHVSDTAVFDVRLAVSRDLGSHWEKRDFAVTAGWNYWRPLLAARTGGRLDLAAGRNSTSALYLDMNSSRDYGKTWEAQAVNAGSCVSGVEYPVLRFGNDEQAYLVWGTYTIAGHFLGEWNYFLRRDNMGKWAVIQDLGKLCPSSDTRTALSVSAHSVDAVLTGPGCLFLLRSIDDGSGWPAPEAIAGSEGFKVSKFQDLAFHPSGKTFLVFIKETSGEGSLHLISFE